MLAGYLVVHKNRKAMQNTNIEIDELDENLPETEAIEPEDAADVTSEDETEEAEEEEADEDAETEEEAADEEEVADNEGE